MIATQDAIPRDVCAWLPACAGDLCATLMTGAPCIDFGTCSESGCRWRTCISGVVTEVVGRCDTSFDPFGDAGTDAPLDASEVDAE